MRLLIVGYGKMGRLVDQLAQDQGIQVVGRVDEGRDEWAPADVAIDFTTADALTRNFPPLSRAAAAGGDRHYRLVAAGRALSPGSRGGRARGVASANFSIGVNIFQLVVNEAARLMHHQPEYGAWIHESHHSTKRDAPSGTAILLRDSMISAGYGRDVDMSSTRAGAIPGIHTVGFDGPSDTIELTHAARDRRGFASGALVAARWIQGRRGWFTMTDVLQSS